MSVKIGGFLTYTAAHDQRVPDMLLNFNLNFVQNYFYFLRNAFFFFSPSKVPSTLYSASSLSWPHRPWTEVLAGEMAKEGRDDDDELRHDFLLRQCWSRLYCGYRSCNSWSTLVTDSKLRWSSDDSGAWKTGKNYMKWRNLNYRW